MLLGDHHGNDVVPNIAQLQTVLVHVYTLSDYI